MSDNPATITYLNEAGRLVVPVRRDLPARANDLELTPGLWRIEVEASRPSLTVKVTATEGGKITFDEQKPTEFDVSGAAEFVKVNVELTPTTNETVEVHKLTLTREQ